MRRSEDNLSELVLSYHVDFQHKTQVFRHGGGLLYPLSLLISSSHVLTKITWETPGAVGDVLTCEGLLLKLPQKFSRQRCVWV